MGPPLTNSEHFVFLRESLAKVLTNQSVPLTKAQFHQRIFTTKKFGCLKIPICNWLDMSKGGNFIYPMMHRFILYYQASERT